MRLPRLFRFAAAMLFACATPVFADTIQVAVAANLQYAFDELREDFRRETGHEAVPTFGSSGKFVAQISNGAPFDVFLSADTEYPDKLHAAGQTDGAPVVYAYGALVLWTRKEIDLGNWQSALAGPEVVKIAVANPQTAPYGREAMRVFEHFKLIERVKSKLVFGESIAQTTQYIYSKSADAGITAKSAVLAPSLKGQGKWIDLPRDAYRPIGQGAVILRHGARHHRELARRFMAFLQSPRARATFERYGYTLP
ncbi:MAG TPA: molybdate ABC transporter substrate-binding protein [Paucimonas sp.]|nr:molybdate ABC transporter substrate-binding protein [Paucimonas sp.]